MPSFFSMSVSLLAPSLFELLADDYSPAIRYRFNIFEGLSFLTTKNYQKCQCFQNINTLLAYDKMARVASAALMHKNAYYFAFFRFQAFSPKSQQEGRNRDAARRQ